MKANRMIPRAQRPKYTLVTCNNVTPLNFRSREQGADFRKTFLELGSAYDPDDLEVMALVDPQDLVELFDAWEQHELERIDAVLTKLAEEFRP